MRVEICYQLSPLSALHLPLHYLRSTSRPPVITETADTDYCKYFQIFTSNISAFNPPSLPHCLTLALSLSFIGSSGRIKFTICSTFALGICYNHGCAGPWCNLVISGVSAHYSVL